MTGEPSQPIEPSIFQPVGPEPEPPPGAVPGSPAAASRRSRTMVNGVLAVAFTVVVGGVSFAAGRATAPAYDGAGTGDVGLGADLRPGPGNGAAGGFPNIPGGPGANDDDGRFGPGFGGPSVQGTVTAITGDAMTLQLVDGTTLEIAIDSNTGYHRRADASASDIATGATVIVGMNVPRGAGAGLTARDITIVP